MNCFEEKSRIFFTQPDLKIFKIFKIPYTCLRKTFQNICVCFFLRKNAARPPIYTRYVTQEEYLFIERQIMVLFAREFLSKIWLNKKSTKGARLSDSQGHLSRPERLTPSLSRPTEYNLTLLLYYYISALCLGFYGA